MASQPTYDPSVWVGGISKKQLARLYSEKAGTPLLGRATQGQFAPGSTWKPIMTVGALNNGFTPPTPGSTARRGSRSATGWFKNYESASYGYIGFDQALQLSCDTFFYRVGLKFWQQYGTDETDVDAKDPLVAGGQGVRLRRRATGVDLPGRGARADRGPDVEARVLEGDEVPTTARSTASGSAKNDYLQLFAHEFCLDGNHYRAGDAVNFAIGQGDTIVTPLQLARAYAALSNGGTLYEPRVAKAIVAPDGTVLQTIPPKVGRPRAASEGRAGVRRHRAAGHAEGRHPGLEVPRLPARPGAHPRQDRLGRGLRQAVDLVGGDLRRELRGRDDGQPGRHRLGHLRPGRARDLGVAVRHHRHDGRRPSDVRDPRRHAARRAADVHGRRLDPAAGPRCRIEAG